MVDETNKGDNMTTLLTLKYVGIDFELLTVSLLADLAIISTFLIVL